MTEPDETSAAPAEDVQVQAGVAAVGAGVAADGEPGEPAVTGSETITEGGHDGMD